MFFKNKRLAVFLLSSIFLLALILLVFAVNQRQEIRKEAGSGEIDLLIQPRTGSYYTGERINTAIFMYNKTGAAKEINVGDLDIRYDSSKLNVANLQCSANFPLSHITKIDPANSKISLTCSRRGGEGFYTLPAGASVQLGQFQMEAVGAGEAVVAFERIVVSGSGSLDLGGIGDQAKLTIISCPNRNSGNLTCDSEGKINGIDIGELLFQWDPHGIGHSASNPSYRNADLAGSGGKVDGLDLGVLLSNWNP